MRTRSVVGVCAFLLLTAVSCRQNTSGFGTHRVKLGDGVAMEFAWCPATTSPEWKDLSGGKDYFLMGSPESEIGRKVDETQHVVTLTRGFWLGRYEVTNEQLIKVLGKWGGSLSRLSDYPASGVKWEGCQKYIEALNQLVEGGSFRLPTEAEWEYACRAGSSTALYNNSNLTTNALPVKRGLVREKGACAALDEIANWAGAPKKKRKKGESVPFVRKPGDFGPTYIAPEKGGRRKANAWGLYDMSGNVAEWCSDWYSKYSTNSVTDPKGVDRGKDKVVRGGAWNYYAPGCRSAARKHVYHDRPGIDVYDIGFRLVWVPDNPVAK